MADAFLGHFAAEYDALTRLAAEFAAAYPEQAARLRLSRTEIRDPHVERLLEGTAFLGARVKQRLDDEFPELTDALLGVLYPHYLAPFPSCMMAQFVPKKDLTIAAPPIKPGEILLTETVDGTPCQFATTAPVTLWPIEIVDVQLSGLPLPPWVAGLTDRAAGVLRISLRCTEPSQTFERLGPDSLRFYLSGGRQVTRVLYELLSAHVLAVAFADGPSGERPVMPPGAAVQPAGFAPDEAMLPWPAQGFAGFRLLSEYFAFPEKFMFIDISGIGGKCDAGAGRQIEIALVLDQVPPLLERAIDKSSLKLGCVPLINLFPQKCEAVDLDWTRREYRVDPDLRRRDSVEVWSVEKVRETRLDGTERPWRPFFRMVHGDADSGLPGGSYLPLRRDTDTFLAVDDPAFAAERTTKMRLSIDARCTNRDLPLRLPREAGRPRLQFKGGSASVSEVVPLSAPTATLRPPPRDEGAGGQRFWRLISHLSLSHLSVIGGTEGAGVLREVLRLYDLRNDTESQAVIASLLSVSADAGATARLPGARFGSFCRGLDVRLTFDQQAWQTSGLYLLGSVLERFLALHGSVNGFVRCSAMLPGREESVARWPARSGTRLLL